MTSSESIITVKLDWSLESSCSQTKLYMCIKQKNWLTITSLLNTNCYSLKKSALMVCLDSHKRSELLWEWTLFDWWYSKKIQNWVSGYIRCHPLTGSTEMTTKASHFISMTLDTCRVTLCHFIIPVFHYYCTSWFISLEFNKKINRHFVFNLT